MEKPMITVSSEGGKKNPQREMVSWVKDGTQMCLGRLLAALDFIRGQSALPLRLIVTVAVNRLSRGE